MQLSARLFAPVPYPVIVAHCGSSSVTRIPIFRSGEDYRHFNFNSLSDTTWFRLLQDDKGRTVASLEEGDAAAPNEVSKRQTERAGC